MPDPSTMSPQELYRQWRTGDATAGQAMAQRFSDWYYSLISVRLGDLKGRTPLQRACLRFQQGISAVNSPGELVEWAHGIIVEEMKAGGERVDGGDFSNQLTGGRPPSELLRQAARTLPPEDMMLLAHAYDVQYPQAALHKEAQARGGMPLAILKARYALKHALREHASVPFQEIPGEPNLDYAPLPLYEAARMAGTRDEANFEKWVLSNMGICRDVAEFGVFALALRHGALRSLTGATPTREKTTQETQTKREEVVKPPVAPPLPPPAAAPPAAGIPVMLVAGIAGAVVALGILAIAAYYFL